MTYPPHQSQNNPSQAPHRQRNLPSAQGSQESEKGKATFKLMTKDDEDRKKNIPHEEVGTVRENYQGPGSEANSETARSGRKGIRVTEEHVAHSWSIDKIEKNYMNSLRFARHVIQTPPDSTTGPSSQPEEDTSEKVANVSSLDKPVSLCSMSSLKNLDDTVNFGDQFLHDQPTEDDQEKSKAREESDSNIPDPSHQTVTSTPPLIAPFTNVTSSEPSLLVTPPTNLPLKYNNHHNLFLKSLFHRPSAKSSKIRNK
ncbi:hypothetical protein Tco_0968845 [Tanacetum coccineum]